jgi:hypothetical protein
MFARLTTQGHMSTAIQHGGAGADAGPDLAAVAGKQTVGACGLVEAPDRLVERAKESLVTHQRRLVTDDQVLGLRPRNPRVAAIPSTASAVPVSAATVDLDAPADVRHMEPEVEGQDSVGPATVQSAKDRVPKPPAAGERM